MSEKTSHNLISGALPDLPESGEAHLWTLPVAGESPPPSLEYMVEFLDSDECEQYRRFRFDRDRYLYLSAHALQRAVLSHYTGRNARAITFARGEHGKPYLAGQDNLFFNLSHTRGLVALGVGRLPQLGVDAECLEREVDINGMARRYFAACEADNVLACHDSAQARSLFLQYWTLKESLVKAVGTGLSMPLDRFHFILGEDALPEICFDDPALGNDQEWQFWQSWQGSAYSLAVAVRRPDGEMVTLKQYAVEYVGNDSLFRIINGK